MGPFRLITSEPQADKRAVEDPRFQVRLAVRRALVAALEGRDPGDILGPHLARQPALVDALLEQERLSDPDAVAALRRALGLDEDPWRDLVDRILELDRQSRDPAERLRLAATLLIGDDVGLPASIMALCHAPDCSGLVADLHGVARRGPQRRALEGHLLRMRRAGVQPESSFVLNRRDPAFHLAYLEGDALVLVYREYPGRFCVMALQLGQGVEDVVLRPLDSEIELRRVVQARDQTRREHQTLDEARSLVAESIARLGDRGQSQAWLALGHLVEERLFAGDCGEDSGFVVGESDARLLVDRVARVVRDREDHLLDQLVGPCTRADVLLDLFGVRYLRHLLGLTLGAGRLEVVVEEQNPSVASTLLVGRTVNGEVLTRTALDLIKGVDGWLITDVRLLGVGPQDQVYRGVWARMAGDNPLPYRDYDALPEVEQELGAGLLDDGHRLDEVASAMLMLRDAALEGPAGSLAAAAHAAYAAVCGRRASLTHLCDRYGGDRIEAARLLGDLEGSLELVPHDPRYRVD